MNKEEIEKIGFVEITPDVWECLKLDPFIKDRFDGEYQYLLDRDDDVFFYTKDYLDRVTVEQFNKEYLHMIIDKEFSALRKKLSEIEKQVNRMEEKIKERSQ